MGCLPTPTLTPTTNLQRPTSHLRERRHLLRVLTPEDSDGKRSTDVARHGAVRVRQGSTRPPSCLPDLREMSTANQKREAVAEYKAGLASASVGQAVVASSGVPRLPRAGTPDEPHEHRARGGGEPTQACPACIARTLSRKEMESCPKARKALDAEWESLRFLKRPHPIKGLGAWDEDSVMEADHVRAGARQMGHTVHVGRICELCHERH